MPLHFAFMVLVPRLDLFLSFSFDEFALFSLHFERFMFSLVVLNRDVPLNGLGFVPSRILPLFSLLQPEGSEALSRHDSPSSRQGEGSIRPADERFNRVTNN